MPAGRPTDYKSEYCDQLILHMNEGLSFESFSAIVGVCKDTLYEWAKVNKEFSDAKKRGTELSRYFWEKIGVDGATGIIKNFNCTAWIFNMKNRFRNEWADRQEIEQKINFNFKHLSLEEKLKLIPQAIAVLKGEAEPPLLNAEVVDDSKS